MLKTFDYRCQKCDAVVRDKIVQPDQLLLPCIDPDCDGWMERAWLMSPERRGSAGVIGDECDVQIRHGLCWPDGTPRRFTSKSDIEKEADRRGMVSHVEHKPDSKGSDRSKHTSRWI